MPQLEAFNRRWSIGSDDFVFSGFVDFVIRIVWLVVVIIVYSLYNRELDASCANGTLLHAYFIGLVFFLALTVVLAAMMVYISMQGTISDSSPRRRMPLLLYVRLAVAIPEVTWNGLGTYWAFTSSNECHTNIVNIAKGTVIAGWVLFVVAVLTVVILFSTYGKKSRAPLRTRSFKRGSRRPFSQAKQWEKRCKCMFFCAKGDSKSTSVFSTLAQLSADYFKGVDLVPTDVLAGLILLSRRQEMKRQQLTLVVPDNVVDKRPLEAVADATDGPQCGCLPSPKDWMTLDLMSHYLKYALGSYGWPFYITLTNPVLGACSLCSECRCCSCRDDQGTVFKDNCCMCNSAAFKKTTGIHHDDIVYACYKNEIYEIPFYVVIDRKQKAVVVAIRGTLSLQDVITDLIIERGNCPDIPGVQCTNAHKGILQSAMYIKETLERKHILDDAFARAEGADLVITGHSLGAGAAALLAILLKPTYPDLRCFAFSPPGELVSPEVSEYAQDIVCSCVLGDDIITRQGMLMMDDLKIQIIKAINETKLPKYKILASGCWRMCCGRAGLLDEAIENAHLDGVDGPDNATKYTVNRCSLEVSLTKCVNHSQHIQNTYQPLHLPGQVIHLEESNFSGDEEFTASWKSPEKFTEIIVSPDMLVHHFPDALLDAIDELRSKNHMKSSDSK